MGRTSKQRREQRRENARELRRKAGYRLNLSAFLLQQYIAENYRPATPFLDAINSRSKVSVTGERYEVPNLFKVIDIQRQHNQVVKFVTRYVTTAGNFPERDERLAQIETGLIAEYRKRLEEEMANAMFGSGKSPFEA